MGNCLFVAMPYISSEIDDGDAEETRSLFNDFQMMVGGVVTISPDSRRRGVTAVAGEE
jgi:hypothetical protein